MTDSRRSRTWDRHSVTRTGAALTTTLHYTILFRDCILFKLVDKYVSSCRIINDWSRVTQFGALDMLLCCTQPKGINLYVSLKHLIHSWKCVIIYLLPTWCRVWSRVNLTSEQLWTWFTKSYYCIWFCLSPTWVICTFNQPVFRSWLDWNSCLLRTDKFTSPWNRCNVI